MSFSIGQVFHTLDQLGCYFSNPGIMHEAFKGFKSVISIMFFADLFNPRNRPRIYTIPPRSCVLFLLFWNNRWAHCSLSLSHYWSVYLRGISPLVFWSLKNPNLLFRLFLGEIFSDPNTVSLNWFFNFKTRIFIER